MLKCLGIVRYNCWTHINYYHQEHCNFLLRSWTGDVDKLYLGAALFDSKSGYRRSTLKFSSKNSSPDKVIELFSIYLIFPATL
jgi:hypothetical protein